MGREEDLAVRRKTSSAGREIDDLKKKLAKKAGIETPNINTLLDLD